MVSVKLARLRCQQRIQQTRIVTTPLLSPHFAVDSRCRTICQWPVDRWVLIWLLIKARITSLHPHSRHRVLWLQLCSLPWWRKYGETGCQETGTAFWVRSWPGKGPDCQVTCSDVRAQHNQQTPASTPTKGWAQGCLAKAVLSAPYPFLLIGGTAGRELIVSKTFPSSSPLPFGHQVLRSELTRLRKSPTSFFEGVFGWIALQSWQRKFQKQLEIANVP